MTGTESHARAGPGHLLAGSSTLNGLNLGTPELAGKDRQKRIVADPDQLNALLVDVFAEQLREAPGEMVLNMDATDDRLHGPAGASVLDADPDLRES